MESKKIFCLLHGSNEWRGDIVCEKCGAVYTERQAEEILKDENRCVCGVKLLPDENEMYFSAAPICRQCFFIEALKQGKSFSFDDL